MQGQTPSKSPVIRLSQPTTGSEYSPIQAAPLKEAARTVEIAPQRERDGVENDRVLCLTQKEAPALQSDGVDLMPGWQDFRKPPKAPEPEKKVPTLDMEY